MTPGGPQAGRKSRSDGGPRGIAARGRVRVLFQLNAMIHAGAGHEFGGALGEIPRLEHQRPAILAHDHSEVLLLHDGRGPGHFHVERGEQRRRVAVTERRQREDSSMACSLISRSSSTASISIAAQKIVGRRDATRRMR